MKESKKAQGGRRKAVPVYIVERDSGANDVSCLCIYDMGVDVVSIQAGILPYLCKPYHIRRGENDVSAQ